MFEEALPEAATGTDHTMWGASFFKHNQILIWSCLKKLYQRLQLQFYVLLMMGVMDAQNM